MVWNSTGKQAEVIVWWRASTTEKGSCLGRIYGSALHLLVYLALKCGFEQRSRDANVPRPALQIEFCSSNRSSVLSAILLPLPDCSGGFAAIVYIALMRQATTRSDIYGHPTTMDIVLLCPKSLDLCEAS
nr:hypothetical protein CFP56_22006 [Quercus suber]